MNQNFEAALRYMKIIQMMDRQIEEATQLMGQIMGGAEQIICFHLHSHLLYSSGQRPGDVDAFQDYIDPSNGITNGQVIMIQTPIGTRMLTPQEIKDLISGQQGRDNRRGGMPSFLQGGMPNFASSHAPAGQPEEVRSLTFKLDTGITAGVLQVIVDGYKAKKQEYVDKLAALGVNIIVAHGEETVHTPEVH